MSGFSGYARAQPLQGGVRIVTYQALDDRLGGGIQAKLLPARPRLWGNGASGPVLAQHFLHEGEAHAKDVGNGALRADLLLAGPQDLLT